MIYGFGRGLNLFQLLEFGEKMKEKQVDVKNDIFENFEVPIHPLYDEYESKHISDVKDIETSLDYLTWLVEQN